MDPHGGNSFIPGNGFSSCNVRFRAIDNAGNVSAWSSGVHIHQDTEAPTFVNWWFGTVNSDIIQLYVQATDNVGISKIQLPTSTEKGGGVNWVWIDAVWDASANAYRADIYPSTWGHYGTTYYTHLYIYDYAGNGGYYGNTYAYIETKKVVISDGFGAATGSCFDWQNTTGRTLTIHYEFYADSEDYAEIWLTNADYSSIVTIATAWYGYGRQTGTFSCAQGQFVRLYTHIGTVAYSHMYYYLE